MFTTQQPLPQQTAISTGDPLAGSCEGRFVLTSLDSNFLQSLLPPQLVLAPQEYTPAGFHPLLLMYNYTHLHSTDHLVQVAKQNNLELKLDYNEFILMLPFVQFKDTRVVSDTMYCYLPVLYLDSMLAVMGGRIFWEFNKEMARFSVTEADFLISSEILDEAYFNSSFLSAGGSVRARTIQNFDAIIPILNLPVVEFGPEGYVTSFYKMDYENANLTPSTASVFNSSCKYLPGKASIFAESIEEKVLGAFNMNYDWELSWAKKVLY